jgi:DNA-binding MarR family transcriptional regulator
VTQRAEKLTSASRVGYKVRVAYKVMRRAFAQQLGAIGIPYAYYRCLRPLLEEDGITQTELSLRSGIDTPAATAVIDKMVADGYVRREAHAADRRKRMIFLTDAGRRLCRPLPQALVAMDAAFMEGIGPEEYATFARTLDRVIENSERLGGAEGILPEPSK